MVDHSLSKGVILTPCNKTINAKEIAELFFKNVFCVLDYMTTQFWIEDHNSLLPLPQNSPVSLDMIFNSLQLIIHKLMEKQSV